MSATFLQNDPTAGLSLVSTRAQNLEVTRYIFFAGNLIDPNRLDQIQYMRGTGGGEEIQTHCLRRSTNGFLQRARLMPLEVWAEMMPAAYVGEGAERDTVRIKTDTNQPVEVEKPHRPGFFIGSSLIGVKFYPADELNSIMRANEEKGIVEVAPLAGHEWYEDDKPGIAQLLNLDFFPVPPPIELNGLREMIDKSAGKSDNHRSVAQDMRASCDQFERFALARLATEHTLLRQRTSPNGQFTYTYSPIARELLKQLEMKPQDQLIEQAAAGINPEQLQQIIASSNQGVTPETVAQIVASILEVQKAAETKNKGGRPRKEENAVTSDATGSAG